MEQKADYSDVDKKAEGYYDSDNAYKYYSTIYSSEEYIGNGLYPEFATEKDANGVEYIRGTGVSSIAEANINRDQMMLKNILDNAPKDRKLKVLEMGAGRGGLTRFVAKELLKLDKLEIIVAINISERENQYSRDKAKEQNIPEAVYRVDHYSYDTMPY